MTATETTKRDRTEVPPIPDVPFLIGLHAGDGLVHAVSHGNATWALERYDGSDERDAHAAAECGAVGVIARYWGEFRRDNEHLRGQLHDLCPRCAWGVAIARGTTDAELADITPGALEMLALARLMPDPLVAVNICRSILARRARDEEYDMDSDYWPTLLAHATEHRPVVLLPEACGESGPGCDEHEDDAVCCAATDTVACGTCSIRAGSWAGEWAGQYECTVSAPCSALLAMSEMYGAEVAK